MSISPRHGGNSPAKSANGSVDSNISAMLHFKNNRKRAENDLQLLSNRVALLRSEEERALNKIEDAVHALLRHLNKGAFREIISQRRLKSYPRPELTREQKRNLNRLSMLFHPDKLPACNPEFLIPAIVYINDIR